MFYFILKLVTDSNTIFLKINVLLSANTVKSESSFVIHIALQRQASLNSILFWETRAPAITTATKKKKTKQFIQWNLNIWIYDEYYNWVNSYNSSIMCQHSPLEVLRSKFKCKTFYRWTTTLIKTTAITKYRNYHDRIYQRKCIRIHVLTWL